MKFYSYILMLLLLISCVSALNIDNSKSFSKGNLQYGKITITNAFGLGSKLAEITLLKNTNECLINCEAEGTTTLYSKDSLFSDLNFKDELSKSKTINYKIYVRTPSIQEIQVCDEKNLSCEKKEIGTLIWKEYKFEELNAGTYLWKIEGLKKVDENVDWIATSLGKDLTEWAWWYSNWNKKVKLNITENTGDTLYNYTLLLNVTWNSNLLPDFSDIRFLSSDETTELSYWFDESEIEQRVYNSDHAMVWVKFPELVALTNTTFYMYYNNSEATNSSNIANAWLFGDTFDNSTGTYAFEENYNLYETNCYIPETDNGTLSVLVSTTGRCSLRLLPEPLGRVNNTLSIIDNPDLNETRAIQKRFYSKGSASPIDLIELRIGTLSGGDAGEWQVYESYNGDSSIDISLGLSVYGNTGTSYLNDSVDYLGYNLYEFLRYGNSSQESNWTVYRNNTLRKFPNINDTQAMNWTVDKVEPFFRELAILVANHTDDANLSFWAVGEYAYPEPSYLFGAEENIITDFGEPTITITYPTESGINIMSLNYTVSVPSDGAVLDKCWYSLNGISNTTIFCGDNITTIAPVGSNTWAVYANNTNGNESSDFITFRMYYTEPTTTYNATTFETASESFILSLEYDSIYYINAEATLIYNGTNYAPTKVVADNTANFTASLIVPPYFEPVELFDYNFLWQIALTNSSGNIYYFNTSESTQSINVFILAECNNTYTTSVINFTTYDEKTKLPLNTTFQATFNYWIEGSNSLISKNYSFINSTELGNEFDFCSNNESIKLRVNMGADYGATGYVNKQYFLRNALLSNETSLISLYLLNSSDAVKFFFTLTQNLHAVQGTVISIAKYDSSTGTYNTIGVRQSDEYGNFIEYLELDSQYQFSVSQNGNFLGIFYKTSVCESAPCEMKLELAGATTDLWSGYYDVFADNIAYNLSYNSTSGNFILTFVDLSGLAQYFRLNVDKISYNNTEQENICNITSYSTSGTIICDISAYEGEFYATAYISRSPEKPFAFASAMINAIKNAIGNQEGLFFALLLLIVIALIGAFSPVVGIILAIGVMFFSMKIGFLSISISSIVLILILGVFMIVKISRGGYGV